MSDLPVAIVGCTLVLLVVLGVGLALTVVGLPLLAAGVLACRGAGVAERARARALLGVEVGEPAPFRPRPGFLGWLRSALGDLTGWRAAVYLLAKFPVGLATFVVAAVFYLAGSLLLLYPVIRLLGSVMAGSDGHQHERMSWWAVLGLFVLGGLLLVSGPSVLRPMVAASGSLVRGLLGPTRSSQRIRDLERTRGRAVDDSAAALRRIERDLHDGAQARLVTVALDLGLAKETLDAAAAGEPDLDQARHLVQAAHTNAKQALTELRDLARGIHPPVLDAGLDEALASLAGRSAVPVALHVHLPFRPSPAIESIAYFCAAELLTNVAKHAGARRALVHVGESAGLLRLTVADDGTGGASPDRGSGLAGLRDRVSAVDGTLHVTSPPRGPTVIIVELPIQA
jgi:signal transduction histidine kinase